MNWALKVSVTDGKNLLREIEVTEKNTAEGLRELKALREEEGRRRAAYREYEARKFEEFKNIVKDEDFFRFEHIDRLGIRRDVEIVLSAKNAGKTTEIYREMRRCMDRGEKFVYGRVYVQEMNGAIYQFGSDEMSPCIILTKANRWYFYDKRDVERGRAMRMKDAIDPDQLEPVGLPRIAELEKMGAHPVGLGYTFVNSNMLGGMSYEGFSTIILDEILSYSPVNRINKRVLDAWGASVSTIARTKPNIRIRMCGNLLDVPEHPILSYYGVSVDDDLRIIKRGDKQECTILFVNAGGLYGASYKNQAGVTKHADLEHQAFLKANKVVKPTQNILTSKIFSDFEYEFAFAMDMFPDIWMVHVRGLHTEDDDVYCCSCQKLSMSTLIDGEIFADDPTVYNAFDNITRHGSIKGMFNRVNRLFRARDLKFDSLASLEKLRILISNNQELLYKDER